MLDDEALDKSLAEARTDPVVRWFGRRVEEWFEGEVKKGRSRADVLAESFGPPRAQNKDSG